MLPLVFIGGFKGGARDALPLGPISFSCSFQEKKLAKE